MVPCQLRRYISSSSPKANVSTFSLYVRAQLGRIRGMEENLAVQENLIAHLTEELRTARHEAEKRKDQLTEKTARFNQEIQK